MGFKIVDDIHNKTDRGMVFLAFKTFNPVTDGQSVLVRAKTGAKYLHLYVDLQTKGEWIFKSYFNSTYTDDGIPLDIIKRKTDSKEIVLSNFYHTPTVNALGTVRFDYMFGSSGNPVNQSSSQFKDGFESIFEPNSDILIELTNNSGVDQYISEIFNFYEEE